MRLSKKDQGVIERHEDFGEKIGGAKKDLWKERGLYVEDLEAMNVFVQRQYTGKTACQAEGIY